MIGKWLSLHVKVTSFGWSAASENFFAAVHFAERQSVSARVCYNRFTIYALCSQMAGEFCEYRGFEFKAALSS